jgi:folate-binding Fe-S cluster repair protein YgfZ
MTSLAHLPDRAVLRLGGADRVEFLNGLVSNQVARATPGTAVWAGLLTAQGRYITDFFIFADDDGALLLDMPQAAIAAVAQKFRRMRLRAAVTVDDVSETYGVYAAWDGAPPPVPVTAPDPRLAGAGFRCLSPVALPTSTPSAVTGVSAAAGSLNATGISRRLIRPRYLVRAVSSWPI